jgi:hypothetical protein
MLTYLTDGWFSPLNPRHLHDAVVDGAFDSASFLVRAGTPAHAVRPLAQSLKRLAAVAQPGSTRAAWAAWLADATDGHPALQGLVMDGLEAVHDSETLGALAAHLGHIADAMGVVQRARSLREAPMWQGAPESRQNQGQSRITPSR